MTTEGRAGRRHAEQCGTLHAAVQVREGQVLSVTEEESAAGSSGRIGVCRGGLLSWVMRFEEEST
jgi:hypothetical protein